MQAAFRRSWLGLGLGVMVLVAGPGCRKPQPSPQFEHASAQFNSLYGQKLDDAYLDPSMDGILAELAQVGAKSLDSQAATDLAKRISDGRTRMAQERADREKASLAARTPPPNSGFTPTGVSSPPPSQAGPPDAGQVTQPTSGMAFAEFERRYGDCFEMQGTINLVGQGPRDSYGLKDLDACRTQLPGFAQRLVLTDGRVLDAVVPRTAIVSTPVPAPTVAPINGAPTGGAPAGAAPGAAADAGR